MRHDEQALLYRRQFVLGPGFLKELPTWRRIAIASGLCLTAHPELQVEHNVQGDTSLTLLGNLLDPNSPTATNWEVADRLLRELETCQYLDDFTPNLSGLGGRWVIIMARGSNKRLINDAAGTRQVYYTDESAKENLPVWCASQPELLKSVFKLSADARAIELMESPEYQSNPQYWWPGNSSPYQGIKLLLPNHHLDLVSGKVQRYWPMSDRTELSLEEVVKRNSQILKGTVLAAANRFDLALQITAGFDSRCLLAACRDLSERIYYNTFQFEPYTPSRSPDIKVAAKLLRKLGLTHHIIKCPLRMAPEFEKIYTRNYSTACHHQHWGAIAQGFYLNITDGLIHMAGNVSEVGRRFYGGNRHGGEITGRSLGLITGLGTSSFVTDAFDQWIACLSDTKGYDALDIFYWEQRVGSWAGMLFTEWDTVLEIFAPYNCRDLLVNMLAVDEAYRNHKTSMLHIEMMKKMWPEVLSMPVNPRMPAKLHTRIKRRTKASIRIGLEWTGLLPLLKRKVSP